MKYVIRLCFLSMWLCFVGLIYWDSRYHPTLTQTPDARSGHTVPFKTGRLLYYTADQMSTLGDFLGGGVIIGLIGALLQKRERKLGRE